MDRVQNNVISAAIFDVTPLVKILLTIFIKTTCFYIYKMRSSQMSKSYGWINIGEYPLEYPERWIEMEEYFFICP